MFVRVKTIVQDGRRYEYLQIVRAVRDGARVRQELVASLGRRDLLVASGQLDQLLQALARFSTRLRVVEAASDDRFVARAARSWGAALVFGRLWQRQGLPEILGRLAKGRRFGFDPERVAFALALQRLCAPGWRRSATSSSASSSSRTATCSRPSSIWCSSTPPRSTSTAMARAIWSATATAATAGPTCRSSCSASRSTAGAGRWRSTSCPATPRMSIARFRDRFRLRRAVVVADRGMLGKGTLAELRAHAEAPFDYILGCPLRRERAVALEVLARPGRYHTVADNLEVKEVRLGERRYVVCRNPIEARQDAADRDALLAKLRQTLEHDGPKAVVGNRGYARFLRIGKGSVTLDEAAIAREARLDGKFVLTTSTELPAAEIAQAYKSLWRVERAFRALKSTLDVRPIFHQRDDSVIGHITGCFLALRLEVDLQRRLDAKGRTAPWPDLI